MTTDQHAYDALRALVREPVDLSEEGLRAVLAAIPSTNQHGNRLPQVPEWRFQSMFSAFRFALAGVALTLFGGVLAATVLNQSSQDRAPAAMASASAEASAQPTAASDATPEPTIEASDTRETFDGAATITLPDELPEGVESGTIETPAGPARWVHMSGEIQDPDNPSADLGIPAAQALVPWDGGVAAMGAFGLWTTSDGVRWDAVPLPGDPGGPFQRRVLKRVGSTYVLVYENPLRVWTAEKLDGDWRELDVSELEAAAPGAGWTGGHARMSRFARLTAGPVALEDGRIVFSVGQEYRLPRQELGLPLKETKRMRRLGDDRFALCGGGSCSDGGAKAKWTLRFRETGAGLSVVDDKTGKQLGQIDGADLSELYEGATGLKVTSFEIDGNTVEPIDAPWSALDLIDPDYVWPGSALVFAPQGSTPVLRSWDSRSELRPGDPGVPGISRVLQQAGGSRTSLTVSEHPDRLSAVGWADLGLTTNRVMDTWESTDGVTWREGPPGPVDKARPSYTGSAWYAQGVDERGVPNGQRWMHIGGAWVSIDELGFASEFEPTLTAGLGNVTVFTGDPLRDVLDVWVLTHPVSE